MMNNNWKYNKIYNMEIEIKTGLHIGGSESELKIGGTDSPVITTYDPDNGKEVPYIPGSSIKGKMRSLLLSVGDINGNINQTNIENLFGSAKDNNDDKDRRVRLIIRDAYLIKNKEEIPLTEVKGENTINPITSMANPRFIERITPGTKFEFQMVMSVFSGDDENVFENIINTGISMINDSYLGGNGTRGYGKINLTIKGIETRDLKYYEKGLSKA